MIAQQNESRFLHDLSSPLTITHGNLKILIKKVELDQEFNNREDYLKRLKHAMDACERIVEMLAERRQHLIASGQQMDLDSPKNT